MTTIINNPNEKDVSNGNSASGATGILVGAVLVIIILAVIIFLSMPYIRDRINALSSPTVNNPTVNVQLPAINITPPNASTTNR